MIKRILAVALSLTLVFTITSCSKKSNVSTADSDNNTAEIQPISNSSSEYADKIFGKDVLKVEITTTDDDWNNLIENAVSKPTISGNITIDGETFENVGIKTKGNTSLTQISQTDSDRYSLKINFGKFVDDQTCYGLDKLVLNNIYADTTYLKEYMSYDLFQYMNVPSSLCTFADIYVNGEHFGFYIAIEDTDDSFLDRNYGEESAVEAYKPESMDMGGDNNFGGFDNKNSGMQGDNMPNMSIISLLSLTDKDGNKVEWADIAEDFDSENIESYTTSDGTATSISNLDMRELMSFDFSTITSITDTNGKTLDLSEYTISMQGFGQGNMQMPNGGQGDMPQGENMPDMTMPEMNNQDENQGDMQFPQNGEMGGGFGMNGGGDGVSLTYTDDETTSYSNIFDNAITKTKEEDEQRLVSSLKGISEGENLEEYIDVDEVLRYTACNVFLVNFDSYFSSMGHNYVLAEENGQLSMIPWDYNLSFGTFQGTSSNDAINYAIDTIFNGVSAEDRPIIGKLLEDEENLEKYHEYLRQIAEEYVNSGYFTETIDKLDLVINEYVKNDTTSFYSYDEYSAGIQTLKDFGTLRAESILGQLDGSIGSTTETQKSETLIDSSSLDLSKLGSMNMGGQNGMDRGFDRKSEGIK